MSRAIAPRVERMLDLLDARIERQTFEPGADAPHCVAIVGTFHTAAGHLERYVAACTRTDAAEVRHVAGAVRALLRNAAVTCQAAPPNVGSAGSPGPCSSVFLRYPSAAAREIACETRRVQARQRVNALPGLFCSLAARRILQARRTAARIFEDHSPGDVHMPRDYESPKLAHGAAIAKKIKTIAMSPNQQALRINVPGGFVLVTREGEFCTVVVSASGNNRVHTQFGCSVSKVEILKA